MSTRTSCVNSMALNLAPSAKVVKPLTTRFPKYDAPVSPTGQLKTPPTCTSSHPRPRSPSGSPTPIPSGFPPSPVSPAPLSFPLQFSSAASLQFPSGTQPQRNRNSNVRPVASAARSPRSLRRSSHGRLSAQSAHLNASRESRWNLARIRAESWRGARPGRFRDYGGEAC